MENKKEIKKYNEEDAKRISLSMISLQGDKTTLLKEMVEKIIPACENTNNEDRDKALVKFRDTGMAIMKIFENESHVALMESFSSDYRMFSKEMADNLIKEFNCVNEAEKSLAKLIVNAYIRVLDNSKRLNNELECKNISHERNIYIANLSKQVDRANRQYISALLTLKQLKAPQVEMNIKAHNAFVSNNQQINVNKDENIKA